MTSTSQPILELRNVTLCYEHGVRALDGVSLSVAPGERICVLGHNGSGKSTLASVFAGLLAPDEGSVSLVGEDVLVDGTVDYDAYRRARHNIGLVFQNPDDQIVTSVVEEDVAFGPENLLLSPDEIGRRVHRELGRVALEKLAKADPAHLSGGQKQRVAIAGAMAMEPRVLVLDEPGALLDVRGRRGIMRVMSELQAAGTTIVHITHFMEEALAADRVVVLQRGRLVLQGTPEEVFAHADELLAMGLDRPFSAKLSQNLRERGVNVPITCNSEELGTAVRGLLEKSVREHGAVATSPQAAAGEQPAPAPDAAPEQPDAAPAILVRDVTYSYGTADAREEIRPALDNVSLSIAPGTSAAIIGQTGSGKSTCLRLICALEVPDAGTVQIGGISTATRKNRRLLHGRIGYVMQHPERQLFAETVWDDVTYGPRNLHLPQDEIDRRAREALELVGLTGREKMSPFHLSGGLQRLCAIAGVLAMDPHTLVLDEPTSGLDPAGRIHVRSILRDVQAKGVAVVQVTHSMSDAARCQHVFVLSDGHLILEGSPAQVFCEQNAQLLHGAGLGLPNALPWAIRLSQETGVDLGQPLTTAALVDALVAQLEGRSSHGA